MLPLVSPLTTTAVASGSAASVGARTTAPSGRSFHVALSVEYWTRYSVSAVPAAKLDGVKLTVTCPLPDASVPSVGVPGSVFAAALADERDHTPAPLVLRARTWNTY